MNKIINKIEKYLEKKSFRTSDQIFFAQRLSLLLNSGIPIIEALTLMSNMDKNKYRKNIYANLIKNIENGTSLAKSINLLKIQFNDLLVNLIQNGEITGRLSEALSTAYHHLEKKNDMKNKIISSLMYPGFIVMATILMTLFLILYIFPKIIPLLKSLDIKLPLITRIVLHIYNILLSYGVWMVSLTLIVSIVFVILKRRSNKFRLHCHKLITRLPILSKYLKIYRTSSLCSMGSMLLSSGRSLPEMVLFSENSSRNLVYKMIFKEIHKDSLQGISFSNSLKKFEFYFPLILKDMCVLGERTGSLSLMLEHCAKIFEGEMDNLLKKFSSLVEPILMVFMGIVVGGIALSIILPVYEITNHLSK
jgi:type IV pilus assembly protein PilC